MAITLEQAKNLKWRETLYHVTNRNADGTPQRWRVNGKPKTWKRSPERVRVPVKHGLRSYDYLTEHDLDLVCLDEREALGYRLATFERFELEMTLEQALYIPASGPADAFVADLLQEKNISDQLDAIGPEMIAEELDEYGAWDEDDLADVAKNRARIVWIAAGNIREENAERS